MRGELNWCPNGVYGGEAGTFPYFTGTYGDYYYLRANHPVFRVPEQLPDSVLGFVNCAMGTVTEGLMRAECGEGGSAGLPSVR